MGSNDFLAHSYLLCTELITIVMSIVCILISSFTLIPYSGKLWWWKTLANGQNNELAKKILANK